MGALVEVGIEKTDGAVSFVGHHGRFNGGDRNRRGWRIRFRCAIGGSVTGRQGDGALHELPDENFWRMFLEVFAGNEVIYIR